MLTGQALSDCSRERNLIWIYTLCLGVNIPVCPMFWLSFGTFYRYMGINSGESTLKYSTFAPLSEKVVNSKRKLFFSKVQTRLPCTGTQDLHPSPSTPPLQKNAIILTCNHIFKMLTIDRMDTLGAVLYVSSTFA